MQGCLEIFLSATTWAIHSVVKTRPLANVGGFAKLCDTSQVVKSL